MVDAIPKRNVEVRAFDASGTGRAWSSPLQVEASVEQSKRRRPNKGTAKLYNLSDDSISWLENDAVAFEVLAGSRVMSMLYRGDISRGGIRSRIQAPNVTTEITGKDGGLAFRQAEIYRSFSPGTTSDIVLSELASVAGKAVEVLGTVPVQVYESGYTAAGLFRDEMDTVIDSLGLEWSIQDDVIQIIGTDAPTVNASALVISPSTGLIGSPERRDKGISVKCELSPTMRPGRIFMLESLLINGFIRVTKSVHKASSDGETWLTDLEGVEL